MSFSTETLNISNAWGLSVNYDEGFILILIATDTQLVAYHLANFGSQPQVINKYSLPFYLVGRPDISTTSKYIAC